MRYSRPLVNAVVGGDAVAPERDEVEALAHGRFDRTADGGGADDALDHAQAHARNRRIDRGHLAARAVERRVREAQQLGGERHVDRDAGAEFVDIDLLGTDQRQQVEQRGGQRRQVARPRDRVFQRGAGGERDGGGGGGCSRHEVAPRLRGVAR
jgi:hypothetical protein